jgi:NADPH:quinone reductase
VDAKLRANGSWANLVPPVVLGYDAAGIVDEVDPSMHDLAPGDEVRYTPEIFGNPHGTYAEYQLVPARLVAPKPTGISFFEAAAVPLAGGTAWEAVIRRLALVHAPCRIALSTAANGRRIWSATTPRATWR